MKATASVRRLLNKGAIEVVAVSFATAIGQLALLIGIVIVGRTYGVAEVGRVSLVLALGGVAAGLFDFGTSTAWVRDSASGKMSKSDLATLLGRKMSYGLLFSASLAITAYLVFRGEYYFLFGAVAWALIANQSILVGLRAESKNLTLAFILVLEKSLFLLCFFALSYFTAYGGVSCIVWAQTSSAFLSLVVASPFLGSGVRPRLKLGPPADIWLTNRYFGFSSVAVTAQRLDVPLVTAASGDFAAGQYGAVNRWTQPMGLLTQTFSLVVTPYVARTNSIRVGLQAVGVAKTLPLIAVLICGLVAFLAEDLVLVVMGNDFEGSVAILRILAISTALGSLNQPLAALLQAVGYERSVSFVIVAGVSLSLLLTVPLALAKGGFGAAVALLVGQAVMNAGLLGVICVRLLSRGERVA